MSLGTLRVATSDSHCVQTGPFTAEWRLSFGHTRARCVQGRWTAQQEPRGQRGTEQRGSAEKAESAATQETRMGGSEVGFLTGYVSPGFLFDGEPVTAQVLHGVYVIVAEEAQADLAERAGQHRLCHSHLRGRGVRRAAHPHTPGNLPLRQSARLAGWEGSHWPHAWRASPLRGIPTPGITDTPPWREGLGGWRHPEAPSLLTQDAPEPCGGQLASGLCSLPSQPH